MSNTLGTLNPRALDSYVSLSVAGSANVTLSADQAQKRFIKLTGALTGNITVSFPFGDTNPADAGLEYIVENATTGAFTITIASAAAPAGATWTAGAGKQILQGNRARVSFVNTSGTTYDFVFTQPHVAVLSLALTPVSVAQQTTAEQTFTTAGCEQLLTTDAIAGVSKPTNQAGLGLAGYRVSAAGTLALSYANIPALGGITPTAETYKVTVVRI